MLESESDINQENSWWNMGKMVECQIDSVRVSLTNQDRVIVLKDKTSERYVPIWIGPYEAESITIALQNIAVARPLTHDLVLSLLHQLEGRLLRVEITGLVTDTYYANLVIETDKTVYIDCRPSDAMALVARTGVPIFVDDEILAEVCIKPEENMSFGFDEDDNEEEDLPGDISAFENFLDDLQRGKDRDDLSDQEPPSDPEPDQD